MGIQERFVEKKGNYRLLHRKWPAKARKAIWWLMGLELLGLVPILVIFGISQPDLYRTDLWRIGYLNGYNSNPNRVLYAYANYQPMPPVALVWTRTLTDFNVAISVVSLFLLLSKLIGFIMRVWFPIVATFFNICLVALYAVSTYGQIGPDYTDDRYPAPAAWYFRYGCGLAKQYNAYKSCQIAQSSLGVTFYMLALYLIYLGFSLYAMWPNPDNDLPDEDDDDAMSEETRQEYKNWEMQNMKTPTGVSVTPFTPRTQAFHTLDRTLPLRQPSGPRYV